MSSPNHSNLPPGDDSGKQPARPGVSPTDPTRTQWSQAVRPGNWQQVSPHEPTLTQWPPVEAAAPPQPPPEPPPAQKTPRRGPRSLFWPGFAAGFLLLSALSCGVLAAALGLNQLTLDNIRGGEAAWTPMPVTPTAAIVETAPETGEGMQPVAGSTRFVVGQTVRNVTNSRVNIRLTPGYLGKGASDVIGQLQAGQTLEIVGDPTAADDLMWWRVQAAGGNQTVVGWVAESTASGVQILGPAQ